MSEIFHFLRDVIVSAWSMLCSASPWMIFSFIVAGALREFLNTDRLKKITLGTKKISGVFWATVTGMCIPICSCGTIPLGISMYFSGAYLGPTLTFMTSTPMINPISIVLAYGLLGREIATIYVITGFAAPMLIGIFANRFAGDELYYRPAYEKQPGMKLSLQTEKPTVWQRIRSGLRWAFCELTPTISKFTVSGMLLAGVLFTVVPQSAIQQYLGTPGMVSLLGITVVAAVMYVCAIGHMPFIAALVASGAAPGVAVTFLMAGCATNIAELLTIRNTIGRRAMLMYSALVVILSEIAGYVTNLLLMPGFKPALDFDAVTHSISYANSMMIVFPGWLRNICSAVLTVYAARELVKIIRRKLAEPQNARTNA